MTLIATVLIGFIAGLIARALTRAPQTPKGFLRTSALGIAGAFVATFLGQAIGWYGPGDRAGLIGAVVGALIVLTAWSQFRQQS